MRTLDQAGDINGKKAVLRVDFDVPVRNDGRIQEEFRIARQKHAIKGLLSGGARVLMLAHIKAVDSFERLIPQIQRILELQVKFCRDTDEVAEFWADGGSLALLDNTRQDAREEADDAGYAELLAKGADFYVNNAFAVCHRDHASVVAIASVLPSYAGPLIIEEIGHLGALIDQPADGKVIYMAGAKAFIDLALSPEAQALHPLTSHRLPVVAGVKVPAGNYTLEDVKIIDMDRVKMGDDKSRITKKWDDEIGSKR